LNAKTSVFLFSVQLVEFMLRKVMEEFEHHLLAQRRQVVKLKSALKDLLLQAEERASQNMVLEALAAGSQEEVKVDFWDSMLSLLPRP
jgi:hypothetical protein